MYHAVVSSSLDSDRLDYIIRDRYMTGVGAGAIDLEWMMDNVRVALIDFSPRRRRRISPRIVSTVFVWGTRRVTPPRISCFARYRLYANVYFHKATRGFEQLISAFFRHLARTARETGRVDGLACEHPLVRFFVSEQEEVRELPRAGSTPSYGARSCHGKVGRATS